jgi:hypothetical protein
MKGFDKSCRIDENSRMKKQHVQLSQTDRKYLEGLISKGEQTVKAYRRALALLELDRGQHCVQDIAGDHSDRIGLGNEVP